MSSQPSPAGADRPTPARGTPFWIGVVVGVPVMVYGTVGLLDAAPASQPTNLVAFLAGLALVHDLVVAPVVVAVGWLVGRVLPPWARVPVWLALAASALLVLVAWPLVRGWGRRAASPSLLPLDYGTNLLWSLGAVWATAAVVVGWRAWRRTGVRA